MNDCLLSPCPRLEASPCKLPPNISPPNLKDRVALVAGATRGVGRGIALAFGEAGATVYCTGRSTKANRIPTPGRQKNLAVRSRAPPRNDR